MQFQVPQFLEVEDKLFGFMTLRQFLYLFGGAAFVYIAYAFLPLILTVVVAVIVAPLVIALAFFKVNNAPFISFVEGFIKYGTSARLYIWKKTPKKIVKQEEEKPVPVAYTPRLTENKLKDLAWTLDIHEHDRSANS